MGTKSPSPPPSSSRKQQRWCNSSNQGTMLTPLMEGPDVHQMHHHLHYPKKHDVPSTSISSWDVIREWFRTQRSISSSTSTNDSFFNSVSSSSSSSNNGSGGESEINARGSSSYCFSNNSNDHMWGKRQDLRLLLGVLGCPLAPIPLPLPLPLPTHHHHHQISISTTNSTTTTINHNNNIILNHHHPLPLIPIRDIPIARSTAHYIIQQYLAAAGCLKSNSSSSSSSKKKKMKKKNMYAAGTVNMTCWETEICSGGKTVKKETILGGRRGRSGSIGEKGCFVVWAMGEYSKWWSLELSIGNNNDDNKVLAGSDGTTVWRHTPWLGTHAAKGPHRPLRRLLQGLDPESTGRLFAKAECIGEKRMGEEDCFVLRVAADREEVMERNEGPAEVIRHVLYGYFSQKTGLLLYLEDSHLTRVVLLDDDDDDDEDDDDERVVYWETSIGSSIEDYREVEGFLIAHEGRTIATVFRFSAEQQQQQQQQQGGGAGEEQYCSYYSRTRLEEVWRIDDVVFNVPGLSFDSFLPPSDLFPPGPLRSS